MSVEKISRAKLGKYFLLPLKSFVKDWRGKSHQFEQNVIARSCPFVFVPILLHKYVITIRKFAASLSALFCQNMTHLSAGMRFVGTHLSIETTSVSLLSSSPTHHWCMVSPGKETVDLPRLQVRSPPPPVGQSGCSGGGEGRFLGGASSAWRRLRLLL